MALTQVRSDGIADGAVTADQIAANAVTVDDIADGSISTAKLADDAVTADKLADTAVTAGSYTFANVTVDAQGRVTAASSGTISSDAITEGNTSAEVVDTGTNGHFKVTTEGTRAMTIDAQQRVGIGVDSPSHVLHVIGNGGASDNSATSLAESASKAKIRLQNRTGSTLSEFQGTVNSGVTWYSQIANSNGSTSYDQAFNPFGGNVGIGNINPSDYYNSQLVIGSTSTTNTGLTLSSSTSGTSRILFADADSGADRYRAAFQYNQSSDRFDWRSAGDQLRMSIDSSGNLLFNSGYGSTATAYGVRAWVHFNGGDSSIGSGDASGNCSSITDNGTGDYTFNFSNSMPDANYCIFGSATYSSTWGGILFPFRDTGSPGSPATGSFRFKTANNAYSETDMGDVMVGVVR